MRKLATIQKIKEIVPIEGADAIELAVVNGWKVVVAKNVGHKEGDLVIYCEIDSFLPIKEEFEFLRKSSYKKMSDGTEGFRLKTIKLRGQISQGLILPLSVFSSYGYRMSENLLNENPALELDKSVISVSDMIELNIGNDVTEILGIVKYEPPIPAELAGKVKGLFPSFLSKTDEERIQNLVSDFEEWKKNKKQFYITEKLDGSSATFYYKDGEFGVCSRNLELLETEDNTFWKVARKLDLENKLKNTGKNLCLQGELIGEGIQGNPYKVKGQTVKFFNIYDIDQRAYYGLDLFLGTIEHTLGLETVPVLNLNFLLPDTINDLLQFAEGKSELNPSAEREGIVIRSLDRNVSFKVISNKFLLNEK
jgi:RNA ligase (TIGR02306 family)